MEDPPPSMPAEDEPTPGSSGPRRFPCAQCGAKLEFAAGTDGLVCPYCGRENVIGGAENAGISPHEELDLQSTLSRMEAAAPSYATESVKCQACAASIARPPNLESFACPYCGSNIVTTAESTRLIKPRGVLPFKVTRDAATLAFRGWLKSLWFAPSALKRHAAIDAAINGLYLPYWTYDCRTETPYSGQRGDYYYVTVPYTTVVNGKTVARTRQERRTRWSSASGRVRNAFDDLLVIASTSLPPEVAERLQPWDLADLKPYDDAFLAGFVAERYQVDLAAGFTVAQGLMRPQIEMTIRADIGGDEQRIADYRPAYFDMKFKHLLLPVWISAFRYLNKVYRFYVNARTGEVTGERPYSYWKIAGAVVGGLLIVGGIVAVIVAVRGS